MAAMNETVIKIRKSIEEVLRSDRLSISKLILFGSRAKQSFNPESDYDFLLVISEELPVEKNIYRMILESLAGVILTVTS